MVLLCQCQKHEEIAKPEQKDNFLAKAQIDPRSATKTVSSNMNCYPGIWVSIDSY